jgi:hypothetical protein
MARRIKHWCGSGPHPVMDGMDFASFGRNIQLTSVHSVQEWVRKVSYKFVLWYSGNLLAPQPSAEKGSTSALDPVQPSRGVDLASGSLASYRQTLSQLSAIAQAEYTADPAVEAAGSMQSIPGRVAVRDTFPYPSDA